MTPHPLLPLLLAASVAACGSAAEQSASIVETGHLQNPAIVEASGVAPSLLVHDRFWLLNDAGSPPVLYAVGSDGGHHGSVTLEPAANVDWEAIASFELDGRAWLLAAEPEDCRRPVRWGVGIDRRGQVERDVVAVDLEESGPLLGLGAGEVGAWHGVHPSTRPSGRANDLRLGAVGPVARTMRSYVRLGLRSPRLWAGFPDDRSDLTRSGHME